MSDQPYIDADRHLRNWYIFGEYTDGCVDVYDGETEIVQHVSREVAARILAARDAFAAAVLKALWHNPSSTPPV